MTNERRFSIWNDAEGRQVQTYLWGNASLATIQAAIAAKSNGALLYNTESSDLGPTQASTAGPYNSNVDRAVLLYNDAAGYIVPVVVPMPVDTMFLADMVTVDATQITAISAAVIGVALSAAGLPAVSFRSGYRSTAGQQPAGIPATGVVLPVWRFASCNLQYSLDSGTTWTTVAGWSVGAPGCYTGAPGAPGAPGGYTPGTPGNPQGVSVAQQACNIASYLAVGVVQMALSQQVSNYTAAKNLVDSAVAIAEVIGFLDPVWSVAVASGAILFNYYTAATIAPFTTASTDATLLSDVQCAIYTAIAADGLVDSSNVATVLSNLAGISYASAVVVSAIHDYVAALGLTGLQQLQLTGSLYEGDCSACGLTGVALAFSHSTHTKVTLGSDVNAGTAFTVGGWINATNTGVVQPLWIAGYGAPGFNHAYGLIIDSGNVAAAIANHGTGFVGNDGATTVTSGNHLIVMTYDGTTIKLYVDGVLDASTAMAGPVTLNEASGVTTLGANGIWPNGVGANLWQWAFYPFGMTAAQVLTWFHNGTSAAPPAIGATHVWGMQEGSGTTVGDTGGDSGTITPSATWTTHT